MWPVSTAYLDRWPHSKTRAFRAMLLDASTLGAVQTYEGATSVVLDGSVSAEDSLYERSANVTTLWERVTSEPIGAVMRLECGITLATGDIEWVPMITMVVDDYERQFGSASAVVELRGRDRIGFMAETVFGAPWSASPGDSVGAVIRRICQEAGLGTADELYDIDDGGRVLATTFVMEEDDTRGEAVEKLKTDHSLTVKCLPTGVVLVRPNTPVQDAPVVAILQSGDNGTLLGGTINKSQKGNFNRVIVVGEAPDFPPVRAEARDMDPLSPTYNPPDGTGPSGDRVAPIDHSTDIRSYEQAYERAKTLLEDYTLLSEVVSVTAVSLPPLSIGDRVKVINELADVGIDFIVDKIDWPLGVGSMALGGRRVRPLF